MPSKYWMVHNTSGNAPTKTHSTIEEAKAEAGRLAAKNVGATFVVLEAIAYVEVALPPLDWKTL
jgi:hypothetical protein